MQETLNELKNKNNFRSLKRFKHENKFVIFNNQKLLNFASNDYLGIASDGILQNEFLNTHKNLALSSSSSRSLSGGYDEFFVFEEYLEKIYQKKALLFNSGYTLNYSCLSALATLKNILFIADKKVHASIIDGIKNANFKRYKHNDLNDLKNLLIKYHKDYEKIVILSEAMFSMDADFANIDGLIKLKKEFKNVMLYIDEAHSVGSLGEKGLGLCKNFSNDIDFIVLTFGKSIASVGAVILCNEISKDFFINKARGLIYSTALAPINVAFSHYVFKNLDKFDEKRRHLKNLSLYFNENLKKYNVIGISYIKMIIIGDNDKCDEISQNLLQKGFYVPSIKTPTVALKDTGLRLSLNASMDYNDIDNLIKALNEI